MKELFRFCSLILLMSFLLSTLPGCGTVSAIRRTFSPSAPNVSSAVPEKPPTVSPPTVSGTVKTEVVFMRFAALLLAMGAGAMAYFGNWLTAAQLGIAALVLPICATFFSLYWGWIIAGALTALAAYVYLHYKTVIDPAIQNLEAEIKKKV